MRPLTIIQARMDSTRLPGKALADIAGKPVLEHVLDRLDMCEQDLGRIVVATTDRLVDRPIVRFCAAQKVAGRKITWFQFRGPSRDVLKRFAVCHAQYAWVTGADPVIRITADCPFLDPGLLDDVVALAKTGRYDYVCVDETFVPPGWHQEAFTADALIRADREATSGSDREHVVPWMIRHVRMAQLRVTNHGFYQPVELNTEEDLVRLRAMTADLSHLVSRIKTVTTEPQTIDLKGFRLA